MTTADFAQADNSIHDPAAPLYRAADELIAEHGERALELTVERASTAIRNSDMFSSSIWKQLHNAVAERLAARS